jgi:hypothetical protein
MEDLARQVKTLKIYVVLLTLIVITFMILYAALLHSTHHFIARNGAYKAVKKQAVFLPNKKEMVSFNVRNGAVFTVD